METNLKAKEKISYGVGAVGKDMVYMLSASYILYYYQDILGVKAYIMGIILMAARVFDAFNDPIMGVLVAKTKTRWGKFRPWLLIGTVLNAVVLFFMFSVPPSLTGTGLVVYAAAAYILWGITYTMMDIPYWSMIPAFTKGGKEREGLSTLARSCAGVGSAIVTIITMKCVVALGAIGHDDLVQCVAAGNAEGASEETKAAAALAQNGIERYGFSLFGLAIAILFVVFIGITCINIKEKSTVEVESPSVKQMFKALIQNDQAMTIVGTIVLINSAIYITSNLVIYFFKYDFGGEKWYDAFTLFNTFGGGIQIISMMIFFPLLRKFMSATKVFYVSFFAAMAGYIALFALTFFNMSNVYLLFIPAFFIFCANGMLSVLTTVFLANTVDYGELKNNRRDESVIFSMQTFVVKLASGVAILIASCCLSIFNLQKDAQQGQAAVEVAQSARLGLRMTMTVLPVIVLFIGFLVFKKHFILTEEKVQEITDELKAKHEAEANA